MTYDVVVVGGGTAGCVVASRLSEQPHLSVLLLEAGPDYTAANLPKDIESAAYAPATHDWGYRAQRDTAGHSLALPRGKVIGGSSSTNYCFAMRGRPADHDKWAELGNEGWSYADLLPFYKRMESCTFGDDAWHGRSGPYRLSRCNWADLEPTAEAAARASEACGHKRVDDTNAPGTPGFGLAPLSAVNGIRQSTALTYLNPARDRPNLTIRGSVEIDRLIFDGNRAVGVRLTTGEEIAGKHIVVTAGSYNSPAILMRSGVGPAEHLRSLDIDVVADRAGVGQNLTEHPVMWNIYAAKPPTRPVHAMFQTTLSVRSTAAEPDYDLQINPTAAIPTEAMPRAFIAPMASHPTGWDFVFFVSCVQPKSRGSVRLASPDATVHPLIDLGLYTQREDIERVATAVRIARRLAATSPLSNLLEQELAPGYDVADADLPEAVRNAPSHYNHASSTCRMAPVSDPLAVVDNTCAVIGTRNLYVVDASIMPSIPRVPTAPCTIVIAERACQWLAVHYAS